MIFAHWLAVVLLYIIAHVISVGVDHDACTAPCDCYYRSGDFYVDCRGVGLVKLPLNIPTKTNRLYLQGNDITDVGITSQLPYLPNLEILFLHNNPIRNVTSDAFENVTAVTMILLHYTDLYELPNGVFDNNTELEYLWFSNSDIHTLGTQVFDKLTKLEELLLDANAISSLHNGMFRQNQALRKLNFKDNDISSVDCCHMCGVPASTTLVYNKEPMTDTELHCDCGSSGTCSLPDGGTFALSSCYPQTENVCPNYFFNAAPSLSQSRVLTMAAILLCAAISSWL